MSIYNWMSWEGGVDLVAATQAGLPMPNVILHVARMVHTPVGSAPAGMILFQPDVTQAPVAMGFISPDINVAAYFGPKIFAGTPFEKAPVIKAQIEIFHDLNSCGAQVTIGDTRFSSILTGLKPLEMISRPPAGMTPFTQSGLEAVAEHATLKVNGKDIAIIVPSIGISGGAAAVWSPTGIYAR